MSQTQSDGLTGVHNAAPQPIEERALPNGLQLQVWDDSRRIAAERFQVVVRFTVSVRLDDGRLDEALRLAGRDIQVIRRVLGDRVAFEQRLVRNFVDQRDKEETLQEIRESYIASALGYLGAEDFGPKLVLQRFAHRWQAAEMQRFFTKE
jgi:hypothetical protein